MSLAVPDRLGLRRGPPHIVERYLVKEAMRPLFLSLGVVLTALLLERMLRLFDLLAQAGGPFAVVLQLTANLVPHYLGLALPAAFFISIFSVVARLGDDNELDALMSAGLSLGALVRPFLVVGIVLSVLSIGLFGYLQPYSRYAYRAILHAAINAGWDARAQPQTFVDAGRGFVLTADEVDGTGRRLTGLFMRRITKNGEEITTARHAVLTLSPDASKLLLVMDDGMDIHDRGGDRVDKVRFSRATAETAFDLNAPPFRPRGGSERELTMGELEDAIADPATAQSARRQFQSEFHARLVRSLSLPFLPLLGVPLAMAAKRRHRTPGLILSGVLLLGFHHMLQLGESLGDTGLMPPIIAVWLPFALLAGIAITLFRSSRERPGENFFTRAVIVVSQATDRLHHMVTHRRGKAS